MPAKKKAAAKRPAKKRDLKSDPDQANRFRSFAMEHGATDADALDKTFKRADIKKAPPK